MHTSYYSSRRITARCITARCALLHADGGLPNFFYLISPHYCTQGSHYCTLFVTFCCDKTDIKSRLKKKRSKERLNDVGEVNACVQTVSNVKTLTHTNTQFTSRYYVSRVCSRKRSGTVISVRYTCTTHVFFFSDNAC